MNGELVAVCAVAVGWAGAAKAFKSVVVADLLAAFWHLVVVACAGFQAGDVGWYIDHLPVPPAAAGGGIWVVYEQCVGFCAFWGSAPGELWGLVFSGAAEALEFLVFAHKFAVGDIFTG